MRSILISVIVSLALLKALASGSVTTSSENEDYKIYNAVIEKTYVRPDIKRVVLDDQTEIYPYDRAKLNVVEEGERIRKAFATWAIRSDTVASYFARNKSPSRLQNRFALPVPTILLTRKEQYSLSHEDKERDYWSVFYKHYPDSTGVLALSRVGFSASMDQAFVYARNTCGSLCGVGEYYLLSKKNGAWRVEAVLRLWVS